MHILPVLKSNDTVEIIAPASRCADKTLTELKTLLLSWQLNCRINDTIFGDDILCANTDELRFKSLNNALQNPEIKAVICVRGGYGSMRLIPNLAKSTPPISPKLFIGMSDITALNLFLQQQWRWPTIHAAFIPDQFSPESILAVKSLLFGNANQIKFDGLPLNVAAEKNDTIEAVVIGGNLTLLQASIGTLWQVDSRNKILFIEEVGERGYRIDRMLEHLHQASIFKEARAILFGDFLNGDEPNGQSLIKPVLERFAQSYQIPIVSVPGIGHGYVNFPLPMGTNVTLTLGDSPKLTCSR
jgi:muramoyltetrapeptide carboxypeptidase